MSGELTWRLPWGDLRPERVKKAVGALLEGWPGVRVEIEVEDRDTISAIFTVPNALVQAASEAASGMTPGEGDLEAEPDEEAEPDPETWTIELSFYDLEEDGRVLALEEEWADNLGAWDAACTLAEELAEALGAEPLDL